MVIEFLALATFSDKMSITSDKMSITSVASETHVARCIVSTFLYTRYCITNSYLTMHDVYN